MSPSTQRAQFEQIERRRIRARAINGLVSAVFLMFLCRIVQRYSLCTLNSAHRLLCALYTNPPLLTFINSLREIAKKTCTKNTHPLSVTARRRNKKCKLFFYASLKLLFRLVCFIAVNVSFATIASMSTYEICATERSTN